MFHDKCGTLLKNANANGADAYYCPACKETVLKEVVRGPETAVFKGNPSKGNIVSRANEEEEAPISHKCDRCGYDKAYMHTLAPIRGDEDERVLYKCGRCDFVSSDNNAKVL